VNSAFGALADPGRGDLIAVLGETTGDAALRSMRSEMQRTPGGRALLHERPRIRNETVASWRLDSLPEGSLGRAYADFTGAHGYEADSRDEVRYVDDEELAYVLQRYREAHDFLHPVCGLPPSVLGEIGLKWFEMVQTGLPMTALSALVGPLRLSGAELDVLGRHLVPWAVSAGRRAPFVMGAHFERMLDWPLDRVRDELGVDPAPDVAALLSHYRSHPQSLLPWRRRARALSRADEATVAPAAWGSWRVKEQ